MVFQRTWLAGICSLLAGAVQAAPRSDVRALILANNPGFSPQDVERVAAIHTRSLFIAAYDRNFDGVIDANEAEIIDQESDREPGPPRAAAGPKQLDQAKSGAKPRTKAVTVAVAPVAIDEVPPFKGVCVNSAAKPSTSFVLGSDNDVITPLIRRNFEDVFLFTCPSSASSAKGAEFGFQRNELTKNTALSVNGMAALSYQHFGAYGGVLGYSLTPYVQFEKLTNSNATLKSKNADITTGGFAAEIGFDAGAFSHYSRLSAALSVDEYANVNYKSLAYEWIPVACTVNGAVVNIGCPTSFAGLFIYRFNPTLLVQYDAVHGHEAVLAISNEKRALRIGSRFALTIWPIPRIAEHFGIKGPIAGFLNSLVLNASYHIAEDVYSGKIFRYFDGAVTYNLDPAGHAGISLSYQRGRSEITSDRVDLLKASLTLKY